jgi:predicted SAM-dependent methyltransferase
MPDTLIKLFNPILEVGGGDMPTFRPNMDIRPLPTVDIVADLEERFPIADESYGTIYGYYLLEHLSWRSLPLFISECHRVIKPGGSAVFTVPNTLAQCKRAANTKVWTLEISSLLFGGQDYSDNAHKNALSPEYAIRMFKEAGFHDVVIHEHPVSDTDMIIEARKSAAVIRIG